MQPDPQHVGAPDVPVVARVGEVLVPNLIDLLARCHQLAGGDREEAEAPVFHDRASRETEAPVAIAGEAAGEIERQAGFEIVAFDPGPQLPYRRRQRGLRRFHGAT